LKYKEKIDQINVQKKISLLKKEKNKLMLEKSLLLKELEE
jgi:hypothetical protein